MGAKNARGIWVPAAGDGLLEAWQTMASQIVAGVQVASPAAARSLLDSAQAAGMGASSSNPILFLIGSGAQKVAYTADGSKTSSKWNLAPLNEVEFYENTYSGNFNVITGATGTTTTIITSSLPAQPYRRVVYAIGNVNGTSGNGTYIHSTRIGGNAGGDARYADNDGNQSLSSMNIGVVEANAAPAVTLVMKAGGSNGNPGNPKFTFGSAPSGYLGVLAFPITMAV